MNGDRERSSAEGVVAKDDAKDGLALLIQDSLDNDPGFVDVWAPLALLSKLIDERIRLGLSQAEVASRMNVARSAVAKLENDPDGVALSRILSYSRALGVELVPKPSRQRPKPHRVTRGRPVTTVVEGGRQAS